MKAKLILVFSYILTLISILILILKVYYPHHRLIAFTIYAISWIPFIYSLIKFNKVEKFIIEHKKKFYLLKKYRFYIINSFLLLFIGYILLLLFPVDNFEYLNIEKQVLDQKINEDIEKLKIYKKGQEDVLILFKENSNLLNKEFNDLTVEDKKILISLWSSYLDYSKELDFLSQTHKYFYQISYLEEPELNSKSFLIAYGAFISNYESFFKLNQLLNESTFIKTLFNEENLELEINKNSYFDLSNKFVHVDNALRLNIGQVNVLYLEKFRDNISEQETDLIELSKNKYSSIDLLVDIDSKVIYETPLEYFEQNTFETWFPAQKGIANGVGHLKLSLREKYISNKTLNNLKTDLEPGDIFLQRREWQLTNVGIPGFWTHAALYLGNEEELGKYFEEIISEDDLKKLIEDTNRDFYLDYYENDLEVIEALADGVILNSYYNSANADYLGVLRTNITKEEKLNSIIDAISYYKKPYDYNFDFVTDNEVVCSELIFKAYHIKDSSKGVPFELEITSGRLMLSPNNIVKQYDLNLKGNYLEFVAFLNYDGEKIIFDSENNFRKSWKAQ